MGTKSCGQIDDISYEVKLQLNFDMLVFGDAYAEKITDKKGKVVWRRIDPMNMIQQHKTYPVIYGKVVYPFKKANFFEKMIDNYRVWRFKRHYRKLVRNCFKITLWDRIRNRGV